MMEFSRRFLDDETGATAIEYGLLLALLAVAIVAAATTYFNAVAAKFNKISATINS
jgi:pilus assembly protein Flp/PilA